MKTALAIGSSLLLALSLNAQTAALTAGDPIPLPGSTGRYDFIQFDTANNRLLLGHEENKSFDVFDLGSGKLTVVATGTSQDAVTDGKNGFYYVSGNDPGRMVIVDAKTLTVAGEVPLPADTDLIGYDPQTGLVHLCNDTAAQQWVIDPVAKKIVTTIKFDGTGLEDLALDLKNRRLYQAVKGANTDCRGGSGQQQGSRSVAPRSGQRPARNRPCPGIQTTAGRLREQPGHAQLQQRQSRGDRADRRESG